MLCGETLEFPSKDTHTSGKIYSESVVDGILDTRPSPGWYPCYDYPAYLKCLEQAVHKVKPDAKIIFSTYNWAYESQELREQFLASMPSGFMVTVSYEMQAKRTLEGLRTPVMDYTLSADAPSEYFVSESANCRKNGIPVQGNVNTAGIAWDFGCVPYVPAPYKLADRIRNLKKISRENGIRTLYATHHYGWWNSFAADLQKWSFWEELDPDNEELLHKIALRDYGKENAGKVLAAWRCWSNAMDHYVASNEDQYGPWRVGPAYPFIFHPNITRTMLNKEIQFPTDPHAYYGYRIIKTLYQPYENENQAPGFLRFPAELRALKKMRQMWQEGIEQLDAMADCDEGRYLIALGKFIFAEITTTIHIKEWWQKNVALVNADSQEKALELISEIKEIAVRERENVMSAYDAVLEDSRIGWEPSMGYVCDKWHLDWKLRQLESAGREIDAYEKIVEQAYARKASALS